MKRFALWLLPLAFAAHAGDERQAPWENRFGIGIYAQTPQGDWQGDFQTGYQASIQINGNLGHQAMGRLRIDFMNAESKRPIQDRYSYYWDGVNGYARPNFVDIRREGIGVSYEWMIHLDPQAMQGPFFIAGIGGIWWRDHTTARPGSYGGGEDNDLAFSPTGGIGYRFNPHMALEARHTWSHITTGDGYKLNGHERNFFSFGASVRF